MLVCQVVELKNCLTCFPESHRLETLPCRLRDIKLLPQPKMNLFAAFSTKHGVLVRCKFVQRYGKEVHRLWAQRGHAPNLLDCIQLAGSWQLVIMEDLSLVDGWHTADSHLLFANQSDVTDLYEAVAKALDVVHGSSSSSNSSNNNSVIEEMVKPVHGDLRGPNVMAR